MGSFANLSIGSISRRRSWRSKEDTVVIEFDQMREGLMEDLREDRWSELIRGDGKALIDSDPTIGVLPDEDDEKYQPRIVE